MNLISAMMTTNKADKMSQKDKTKLTDKRLYNIVNHARSKSTYFGNLYQNLGVKFALSDIPVTSKIEMMENFNLWLTDDNISIEKIKEYTTNADNIGRLLDGKYLVFTTSGSTGNPAVVLYDKTNIAVASAVSACRTFARKQDYNSFKKSGRRTAGIFANYGFYLACGMSRYMTLKIPFLKNKITVDVNAPKEQIIKKLNDFQPNLLSGYPSNLAILCEQQQHGSLNISPTIVITGGEQLTDNVRRLISKTFDCHVQTHYSCTEAGEIACECENEHLHINDDWLIVEAVDKDNKAVPDGKLSDKILVTNLSNYIQPFIRYEITDRVIIHNELCGCGKTSKWLEIEGRTDDILIFDNDVKIAPMSFYKILSHINEISRFQLIQKTTNQLELRVSAQDKEKAYQIAKKQIESFMFEKGCTTNIVLSDELPQAHPISGKFKHIYSDLSH